MHHKFILLFFTLPIMFFFHSSNAKSTKQVAPVKSETDDMLTLVARGVATEKTDRLAYASAFYKHYQITEMTAGDFPITILNKVVLSSGVKQIEWQDNQHIIYELYPNKNSLLGIIKWLNPQRDFSLDIRNSEINPVSETIFNDVPRKDNWAEFTDIHPKPGCVKIKNTQVSLCPKEKVKPSDLPHTVEVFRDDGTSTAFDLGERYYSRLKYDPHSDTYWIEADGRLWRFDKGFKSMVVENYPKGYWGGVSCWVDNDVGQVPCEFLEIPAKYGFLINSSKLIVNSESTGPEYLFNLGGIYFVTKDGQALRIYDKQFAINDAFSVSPDGCSLAFVKNTKTETGAFLNQIALMDLCTYFQK